MREHYQTSDQPMLGFGTEVPTVSGNVRDGCESGPDADMPELQSLTDAVEKGFCSLFHAILIYGEH